MPINRSKRLKNPVGERDHIQGPQDAKVTLVEYGDLECIHCRRVGTVIRRLQRRLGGRLRYVYRHFPISDLHQNSWLAAEATEAASSQGKFWEMRDLLFNHQGQLDESHLFEYAEEIGLDAEQFAGELNEHIHSDHVREDYESGIASGVNGTPTFFINGFMYEGPWDLDSLFEAIQKPLGIQVRLIFQEFARVEAFSGILLIIAALAALIWANSPIGETYFQFWNTELTFSIGTYEIHHSLLYWVNDGLMVIFFFVVGLEIKRELTTGELSNPRRALGPIMAASGGMAVPAVLYLTLNFGGPGESGWGIPMATDIAFMLGVLAILGSRVPFSLKVFFTALAIVDDLGAVMVIALFYTSAINYVFLLIGLGIFLVLIGLNRARIYSPAPYIFLGIVLWFAFLESGVHPTIAGVLLALTIPTRNPPDAGTLISQCAAVMTEFRSTDPQRNTQLAAHTIEQVAERLQSPAQKLEHDLLPYSTYLILPIFAFANAGVSFRFDSSLITPVSVGIILGLVVGKPLGITLMSWLAIKLRLAELPANINLVQIFGASWVAGIGFTMALFIANAAFTDFALLSAAKVGILAASVVAGLIGYILLRFLSPSQEDVSHFEPVPATD
jgi:NhaA family Na+:H+ antiporter